MHPASSSRRCRGAAHAGTVHASTAVVVARGCTPACGLIGAHDLDRRSAATGDRHHRCGHRRPFLRDAARGRGPRRARIRQGPRPWRAHVDAPRRAARRRRRVRPRRAVFHRPRCALRRAGGGVGGRRGRRALAGRGRRRMGRNARHERAGARAGGRVRGALVDPHRRPRARGRRCRGARRVAARWRRCRRARLRPRGGRDSAKPSRARANAGCCRQRPPGRRRTWRTTPRQWPMHCSRRSPRRPVWCCRRRRWRWHTSGVMPAAAMPANGCLWQAHAGLGACGDWLAGPRVECAWLSGSALAEAMLPATA